MGFIRVFLALAVVCAHLPIGQLRIALNGTVAVQIFYIISGYLITHVLLSPRKYPSLGAFYASRYMRLLPIYAIVAIGTLLFRIFMTPEWFTRYSETPLVGGALLVILNVIIIGQDLALFTAVREGSFVFISDFMQSDVLIYKMLLAPQAWTVSLELMFYLLAPFVVRDKRVVWMVFALSLGVRVLLMGLGLGAHDPWSYRFFPAELAFFMAGSLSRHHIHAWMERHRADEGQLPRIAVYVLVAMLVLYPFVTVPETTSRLILFATAIVSMPFLARFQRHSAVDNALGELSYPIYISHLLVIYVLLECWPDLILQATCVGLLTVFSLILLVSCGLAWFVARPMDRLRRRITSAGVGDGPKTSAPGMA